MTHDLVSVDKTSCVSWQNSRIVLTPSPPSPRSSVLRITLRTLRTLCETALVGFASAAVGKIPCVGTARAANAVGIAVSAGVRLRTSHVYT